jgi:DNA-binding transcriptional MerR regulator
MKESLGIGELAARSGRSIHTLRYYESVGLIPFVVRDAGGRRRYNAQHVEWLFFLERLKCTGMTLAEMQQYTALVSQGKKTMTQRVTLLKLHLARVDQQMTELANSRRLLVAKIDFYGEWKATGTYPGNGWLDAYRD